ncbi:hypothetical protein P280DRAFT_458379 [Massarina eburnea CBS 473.64]|uniref:FAD-binding FR-type domain-containing protein n=1 Tax=Massarina eburnea CBS 473.64 TaxID=1395130 RepID=A0A6A6RSH3_9PLEO|nr:hypothetical protein P280DRAFT_458379 [Massarina eburnea CBS 473.64]
MKFGYEFVTLDNDQKHARRVLLEYYPAVAQCSILAVFLGFQFYFFLSWLAGYGLEYERPKSPSFNKRLAGPSTWLKKSRQFCDRIAWWLKKDTFSGWGTRAEWIGGGFWTVWLLYLSVVNTGDDYLHLTKRFGIIGASQLPLHYLLAMRAPYSPVQWVTRLSHEQLKASHQVLGRIIYLLFALHAIFYVNFFILSGFLAKRIKDKDVIFGIISLALFTAISTTALGQLRRWNYRVFYMSHVAIANILVVPLYLHVTHIRPYVWEVVAVNVLHLLFRAQRLKTYSGTVKLLPGTNLVQVRIPLTTMHSALNWQPGQHVYLSLPTGSPYSLSPKDQFALRNKANPFTVASIPVKDKELLLVARALAGNTKKLAELARSLSRDGQVPSIPLAIEGPYGASTHFPDLSTFDKVLLVAGGVGATFVMPIYRSMVDFNDRGYADVRCVWAVQKLADTQWAFPTSTEGEGEEEEEGTSSESDADDVAHSAGAVEVFVTRGPGPGLQIGETGDDVELEEVDQLLSMEEEMKKARKGMVLKTGRPKIGAIVDEVFSTGSRVAVIACGPRRLTRKLNQSVEQWVKQGHEVFYHEESFAW